MEKREPLHIVDGNVNWCSYYGKQFGVFSKKLKIELLDRWSSNSSPEYIPERNKNTNSGIHWGYMHPNVHRNIIWNCQDMETTLSVHQQMKMWYICMYTHTHTHTHTHTRMLLSHKKEWKFAICNNINGLGGHYTKWNNSDRERQILYDICGI